MIRTTTPVWLSLALLCTAARDAHAQVGLAARIFVEEGLVVAAEEIGLSTVTRTFIVREAGAEMAFAELDALAARGGPTVRYFGADGGIANGFRFDMLQERTTRLARGMTDRTVANVVSTLPRHASDQEIAAALQTQFGRSARAADGIGRSLEFDPGSGSLTIGLDARVAGVKVTKATIPVYKLGMGGIAAAGGCEGIVRRVRPDVPSGRSACLLALRGDLASAKAGK